MPCWKASSLCSGILRSCPSSTRLYLVFPGILSKLCPTSTHTHTHSRREPEECQREETSRVGLTGGGVNPTENNSQIRSVHVLHRGEPSQQLRKASHYAALKTSDQVAATPAATRGPSVNDHRDSFKRACRAADTATCWEREGGRCVFPTFPVVSVEVGRVLPPCPGLPAPARPPPPSSSRPAALLCAEAGCDWRSAGIPPVPIGTQAHRGSVGGGA